MALLRDRHVEDFLSCTVHKLDPGSRRTLVLVQQPAETIPPHRQIAVDVRADARTSGVFRLTVSDGIDTAMRYNGDRDATRTGRRCH